MWVRNPDDCALIDQPGAKDFAIITRETFRDGPRASFGGFPAMTDDKVTIAALAANGRRFFDLEQKGPDVLLINGDVYVRCLP